MKTIVFMLLALSTAAWAEVEPMGRQIITCESNDQRQNYCPSRDPIAQARLVHQRSNAPCILGRTWGYDRGGITVVAGCRGDFEVISDWGGGGGGGGGGRDSDDIRCASRGDLRVCRTNRPVEDGRILRGTRECMQRGGWGLTRRGVWVDHGCRGLFRVFYR